MNINPILYMITFGESYFRVNKVLVDNFVP